MTGAGSFGGPRLFISCYLQLVAQAHHHALLHVPPARNRREERRLIDHDDALVTVNHMNMPGNEYLVGEVAMEPDKGVRAVRVAARLEQAVGMEPEAAQARLEVVPGIGPWTSAETGQRSHGAADSVTVGDLHLPGIVGYALAGDRDADDSVMLALLEPYAGQRHRAARLILLSGCVPARRAPRMRRGDISQL